MKTPAHSFLVRLFLSLISFFAIFASLWAAPIVSDDFEGGSFSSDWDDTTGATIVAGTGAMGSANFATMALLSGPFGASFDDGAGGASDLSIDFFFRPRATGGRRIALTISNAAAPTNGSAAASLRYQAGEFSARNGGVWEPLGLPELTGESWYHMRVTCHGWGGTGANWDVELSDADGTDLLHSALSLTAYHVVDFNAQKAGSFAFQTGFGQSPGFDLDNVVVETNDAPPVDDPNISVALTNPFDGIDPGFDPDPITADVTVSNTGTENSLTIADTSSIVGESPANYSILTALPVEIPTGGDAILQVQFDDLGNPGNYLAGLSIDSNDISNPTIVVPLAIRVPSADGNLLANSDFEASSTSITQWENTADPATAVAGIAPGSTTAASIGALQGINQSIAATDGDWYTDFFFQLQERNGRAFQLIINAPGNGQINLRCEDVPDGTWGLNVNGDGWGDPLALPSPMPGMTYFMRIVGHGWDTASPTYDILLSQAGGVTLTDRVEGLTRYRTPGSPPTGAPDEIDFTAEFGGVPGYIIDDVRFFEGLPPEDFPFELTSFEFNEDKTMVTINWSAEPNVQYYVSSSLDLKTWREEGDQFSTSRSESLQVPVRAGERVHFRVQNFPLE